MDGKACQSIKGFCRRLHHCHLSPAGATQQRQYEVPCLRTKASQARYRLKACQKAVLCPFCLYHGSNDISYMNHIIGTHYNAAYSCGKCLKEVFQSGQQLKTHIKVCVGFPKNNTTSLSDWEPVPPGTQDSPCHSSKPSKKAKSDSAKESIPHSKSTKESSSHKNNKKSHKKSKEWDADQQRKSRIRTNLSPRNPTKSKSPPSVHHQIAFMHTCSGTSCLEELYNQLVHAPEVAHLTICNLSLLL